MVGGKALDAAHQAWGEAFHEDTNLKRKNAPSQDAFNRQCVKIAIEAYLAACVEHCCYCGKPIGEGDGYTSHLDCMPGPS